MQDADVIEKVTEPTDWCAPMVPVQNKQENQNLCGPQEIQ